MMKGLFVFLLIFVTLSPSLCVVLQAYNAYPSYNVVNYGATGDGYTDDSNAFVKAWHDVCGATHDAPTLLIPKGKTFMLQPVLFMGPCKPTTLNIKVEGDITAPKSVDDWKWLNPNGSRTWVKFSTINGLIINGGGQLDGQGGAWWGGSYEKHDKPTALRFYKCANLTLGNLTHINSPRNHISIMSCNDSSVSNLTITAPAESPNTDGIDIGNSINIVINNSTIGTGDDCIAINSGSRFINITGIFCGPGHGISVGSLGSGGQYADVEEIHVQNCTINGTQNGARIKTWMGGYGNATKITFEDIELVEVKNPVIINQQYHEPYEIDGSAVKVSNVTYRNIRGTSISMDAIQLNCDLTVGCTDIVIDNVNITYVTGEKTYAVCTNAHGTSFSCNPDVPCLENLVNKINR